MVGGRVEWIEEEVEMDEFEEKRKGGSKGE